MNSLRCTLAFVCLLIPAGIASAAEQPTPADRDLAPWLAKRVAAWQPVAAERRFDDIGWAADIRTAERLAKQHHRPVFLFTHDGRMAIGRC